MKNIIFLPVLVILFFTTTNAQNITVNPGVGSYATLKDAFDAINAGTHTGIITIDIVNNTTETAPAVLNASGAGSAFYTSVVISPSGGAARTITGAIAAGSPLIDLNGADNVTIDGVNTGGNALIISNTTVSTSSNTSTIRFIGGATSNTITNCSVLGSFSGLASAIVGGNIFFSTDVVTGNGNDNNTVSNCNIGPAGINLPTKCVDGLGTTSSTANYNNGIIITGNNIFDYFSGTLPSTGIYLSSGCTDWIITNNRLYQTATRIQTGTGDIHTAIRFNSPNINNCTISGNIIGYANSSGTGTYILIGQENSYFSPIYITGFGSTIAHTIQNNTIAGISFSGPMTGTGITPAFTAIMIQNNWANIIGNTIGSTTVPTSISFTCTNTSSNTEVCGICYFTSFTGSAANISNNTIGGISADNNSGGSIILSGLKAITGSSLPNTITNNIVGYTTAPLINNSTGIASRVIGIYSSGASAVITDNKVSNLAMSAANEGTGSLASAMGIWINNSAATANTISQNTIHSLSNTHATAAVSVTGLHYFGPAGGTNVIQRNFIHSLAVSSNNAAAAINGINIQGGVAGFQNNMIRLGIDPAGAAITNGVSINGINETSTNPDSIYHNSIYLGGAGVGGTANTFAFRSTNTTNTRAYLNNVFYNARSNGSGTGKHYAVSIGGSGTNPTGLTMDYNVYLADGTGGVFGLYSGSDVADLTAWRTAVGQDINSIAGNPQFINATGDTSVVNLHIISNNTSVVEAAGLALSTVSDDYDREIRSGLTPTDIGADAGNFSIVLAIKLTSFDAKKVSSRKSEILWTIDEANSDVESFELYKSTDGRNFHSIYSVAGIGAAYSYVDNNLVTGTNYYRLKIIEQGGYYSYTRIIAVINAGRGIEITGMMPTLVSNNALLNVSAAKAGKLSIQITNSIGSIISQQNINVLQGNSQVTFNFSNLSAGWYNLKSTAADGDVKIIRFIKQ